MNISSQFIIKNALLSSRLNKRAGNRLSVHGISLTEFLVMEYLYPYSESGISRIELADHLGMSASGVTRLLLPMEKTHLLEKVSNPRDSRQSLVRLTDAGKTLFDDASNSFDHIAADATSKLSEAQQQKAIELFEKLL